MSTTNISAALHGLFGELVEGPQGQGEAYILNTGDAGLLRSLDKIGEDEASRATDGGATIAAHAQHVRYGLSLMNTWARVGGNPFADAQWDAAWKISRVDAAQWEEIRHGLAEEARRWREVLGTPREVSEVELKGLIASVAHLAYHLGAIRQIAKATRGPREGTFK